MKDFENWYEVSAVFLKQKLHIITTDSLEVAESKREELTNDGIESVIESYILEGGKPKLVEVIK